MEEIVEPEHRYVLDSLESDNDHVDLSSGQNILVAIITQVIADIHEESIILFDEPELHLHPNAVSNMIRMLYRLLDDFNSYAIISTHSPLIQETPSKYVAVFERIDNTPLIRRLAVECFGENLNNITNEVFGVRNNESNYKVWLEIMSQKMSYEEILAKFDNDLSLNAMTYLNILANQQTKLR